MGPLEPYHVYTNGHIPCSTLKIVTPLVYRWLYLVDGENTYVLPLVQWRYIKTRFGSTLSILDAYLRLWVLFITYFFIVVKTVRVLPLAKRFNLMAML